MAGNIELKQRLWKIEPRFKPWEENSNGLLKEVQRLVYAYHDWIFRIGIFKK